MSAVVREMFGIRCVLSRNQYFVVECMAPNGMCGMSYVAKIYETPKLCQYCHECPKFKRTLRVSLCCECLIEMCAVHDSSVCHVEQLNVVMLNIVRSSRNLFVYVRFVFPYYLRFVAVSQSCS